MARPKQTTPTSGELEILHVLWSRGPSTVREVLDELCASRPRAYTSVMTLMNVMTDKGLVVREPEGRAFVYKARQAREKTLRGMVKDLVSRAFEGSSSALVAHLLEQSKPSDEELAEIRRTIEDYQREGHA